ncbi:MAG: porphobilinogen synthase [Tunicatimonas sp.]|uniref:porphobilinogen synthase n=1 Tax=Tunicatimonas sp. TaxID=1940096 RepID=UPI003C77F2E7
MLRRPRRNRKSPVIRNLIEETQLSVQHLIFPVFIIEGDNQREEVASMPGIYRYSIDLLLEEIAACQELGIHTFAPFPALTDDKKDTLAQEGHNPEGLFPTAIRRIKETFPDVCLMTDIAMDPYSSDGHDGLVHDGEILNDATLEILGKMALVQAEAGADILGPSDMMDGRVGYLRELLDEHGYANVSIMAYTAKYASAFYGPFRDALDSAPKLGDKKTYQMNPANAREALMEAELDYDEGADILMVKPALPYLDIVQSLKECFPVPIAAYQVSGEYAMIKAAAANGWLNGRKTMQESLMSIRRAGADIILTYFAKEYAQELKS